MMRCILRSRPGPLQPNHHPVLHVLMTFIGHMTHVHRQGLPSVVSSYVQGAGSIVLAVTPFNSTPETPRGIELVVDLRTNSMLRGCLERSPEMPHQETLSACSPGTMPTTWPSSTTGMEVALATSGGLARLRDSSRAASGLIMVKTSTVTAVQASAGAVV